MRVLNLLADPRVGGPQVRVATLGRAMRAHGVETIVATPSGPAQTFFAEQGITCLPFEFSRLRIRRPIASSARMALSLVPTARRLASLLGEHHIDVLHCNGLMNIVGPIGARLAGAAVVWHMNDTQLPQPLYRAWIRALGPLADEVVFASRAVADYAGYPAGATIMYPPLDLARFSKEMDDTAQKQLWAALTLDPGLPLVVCVGHLNKVKGHEVALRAVSSLRRQGRPVQLAIVGDPVDATHAASLKAYVRENGLAGHVRFVEGTNNVVPYLQLATVFALPSLTEAMSIALLEAMGAGCACVASDVAGVREAIIDGISGLITPIGDGDALARALGVLLDDPARRASLGQQARATAASKFAVDIAAAAQVDVYRLAVRRRAGRGQQLGRMRGANSLEELR